MIIIVLLISVSLTIALIFLVIFYWSVKNGQYDDMVTPSIRMLFENKARDPIQDDPSGEKDVKK